MKRMLHLVLFVGLLSLLSVAGLQGQTDDSVVCPTFQRQAFNGFSTACAGTEAGEYCYGYNSVVATQAENAPIEDFTLGDRLAIDEIESITSQPYSREDDQWGLSLLRLPDVNASEPNLRYILFGGVEIADTDEPDATFSPLQSFVFATAEENACVDTPSTLFVQSDCDFDARQFRAEGVNFTIDGAAVITGGGETGFINVQVIYGLVYIEADVYSDGVAEPGDVTERITVPVGYSVTAPLNFGEPITSEDRVGDWSEITPLTAEDLANLTFLRSIPQNFGYCPILIPTIRQASGVGDVQETLRFSSVRPLQPVIPLCGVDAPPEFCTYLGLT